MDGVSKEVSGWSSFFKVLTCPAALQPKGCSRPALRGHLVLALPGLYSSDATSTQRIVSEMPNGGAGMLRRNQKMREREAPKNANRRAANMRVAAIGKARADGELAALPPDALGSAIPTEKMEAEGILMNGLHDGSWRVVKRGAFSPDGPHYSWLQSANEQVQFTPPKQAWSKTELPARAREAPVTSVMDAEIDLAAVVIVGGGPHALAALSALNEGSIEKDAKGSRCPLQPVSCAVMPFTSYDRAAD